MLRKTIFILGAVLLIPAQALGQDATSTQSASPTQEATGVQPAVSEHDDTGNSRKSNNDLTTTTPGNENGKTHQQEAAAASVQQKDNAAAEAVEPGLSLPAKPGIKDQLPDSASPERYFVDTRISFIAGDDDFLHKAGETIVDSPLPGFGDRPGYELFFDNLNSARTGRENQLHLVLFKQMKSYIPGLITTGAIVAKYDFTSERDGNWIDDGTYIKLDYTKPGSLARYSVTMFPVSTNRFRLGFLYDLTWGGASIFPKAYRKLTPGVKFSYSKGNFYSFIGMKTARELTNPPPGTNQGRERETTYGGMFGLGWRPESGLAIEANFGAFKMGENPNTGVEGEPVQVYGGSFRLSYQAGLRQSLSADLRLYRTDNMFVAALTREPSYKPGVHWLASLEGDYIMQSLEDPEKYGTTMFQPAYAGAFVFKLRKDYTSLNMVFFSRSVSFILLNVPSFVPYQALSDNLEQTPEAFFAMGLSHHMPRKHLTASLTMGAQMPASVQSHLTLTTGSAEVDRGLRTLVIREAGDYSVLPEGKEAGLIFGSKLTFLWRVSKITTLSMMFLYQYDPNYTALKTLANGTVRVFEDPHKLGAAIVTSMKF